MTRDDMLKLARECAIKAADYLTDDPNDEQGEDVEIRAYEFGNGAYDDTEPVRSALAAIRIMHERAEKLAGAAAPTEWKGEGPPPKKWIADNGTIVYRSYEDYCDD